MNRFERNNENTLTRYYTSLGHKIVAKSNTLFPNYKLIETNYKLIEFYKLIEL